MTQSHVAQFRRPLLGELHKRVTRLFPVLHATGFPALCAGKRLPVCVIVHAVKGHNLGGRLGAARHGDDQLIDAIMVAPLETAPAYRQPLCLPGM